MNEYRLIAAKRTWVPEWLWSLAKPFVLWLWPLREILTIESPDWVTEDMLAEAEDAIDRYRRETGGS